MTTAVAPPAGFARFGAGMLMLGNETNKGLRVMWVHKTPLVLQVASLTALYWAFQFFLGGGRFVSELLAMTFLAYLAYMVAYIAILRMAAGVLEEMYTGTLEQSLLSPLPPWVQSLGRLAAALVEGLATAAVVAGFYLVIFAVMDVEPSFEWAALAPLALVLADVAGFAMLIGGLALIVNSIGAIIHVIQNVIMLVNGAFIPIFVFPDWLALTSKIVIPTTLGLDATRRILNGGESLDQVWSDGTLAWAALHAAVLLVLGWTVYQAAIRRGLREGRLGA
ncbi:MAG: ABC transporter permease [Micromonosporaceae bacterium]|nr:ABC transporter permease [Micromonosporaceae bacterium]